MLTYGSAGGGPATGWRVIRDVGELDALRDPWNALCESGTAPTAEHEWASACAHAFHVNGGLNVVVVVRDGRLVGVAPLAATGSPGELEPLGWSRLQHGSDFLFADLEALEALAGAVARLPAPVRLPSLPAGSPALVALAGAYAGHGMLSCHPAPGAPRTTLSGSWRVPATGTHAMGLGRTEVAIHRPAPQHVDGLLAEALNDDAPGWGDPGRRRFARRYARAMAASGALVLASLRVDGRPAALQLAVERDGRIWLIGSAAPEAAGPRSAAAVLAVETVLDAAQRGVRDCEVLDGGEAAAVLWARRRAPLVAARGYPAELGA
jgi:GNAT acetyltransferase-like protein